MYYIFRGLLGGHVAAKDLQSQGKCCLWYNYELLDKALELGERLLPAFNTSSGIPYPKVSGVDVILIFSLWVTEFDKIKCRHIQYDLAVSHSLKKTRLGLFL